MKTEKRVLIINDGTDSIVSISAKIKSALKGCDLLVKAACDFEGTDLLPAGVLFLGCENPSPKTFRYLKNLLNHINLAGRSCGVFTLSSEPSAKYLRNLVKDTDITLHPDVLYGTEGLKDWVKQVVHGGKA